MKPLNDILYALALPSWAPADVTPFQGFAPGLIDLLPALSVLAKLPSDIGELTLAEPDRLARRRAGLGDWLWSPVNIETLVARRKPHPQQPFMVVISADRGVARTISRWRRDLRIRPLHVSLEEGLGAIHPAELTVERLRAHCLSALREAKRARRELNIDDAQALLESWRPWEPRPTSLVHHSHNVTAPNEMVLMTAGEAQAEGDGVLNCSPEADYVAGVVQSAQAVRNLDAQIGEHRLRRHPQRPDLILLAPAMVGSAASLLRDDAPTVLKRAMRSLDRQRGYTSSMPMDEADIPLIGPALSLRGAELKVQTHAVGFRAMSTLAPTVRLPAVVNRTAGVVRTLARHLRYWDDRLPDTKTARVFKTVQDALKKSVPEEFEPLIRSSASGVKIIGDAPLEWYPIDGLPLCLRTDVSRIDTTPGNILMEQLRPIPPVYIPPDEFRRYLMCNLFEDGDHLAHHAATGINILENKADVRLDGTIASPRTADAFVETVNAYGGPILIVDGHGQHPSESDIGGLIIGGNPVDIWSLRGRMKPPPIVILSACDTHPYDRSHATVANGFLSCGALAVLGTSLPVRSVQAAIFLMRLMLRAVSYGEAVNRGGRAVSWSNIVGGALRMQLASDVVRGLVSRGLLAQERSRDVQLATNHDLNPFNPDWFERLRDRCREVGGFSLEDWQRAFSDILAASDVIRYVSIGNPEAILLADAAVMEAAFDEAEALHSTPGLQRLSGNRLFATSERSVQAPMPAAAPGARRLSRRPTHAGRR
jgi:hypothetical protein